MKKERTHLYVLCNYGCLRLDDLGKIGGLDMSGGPGHAKKEDSPNCNYGFPRLDSLDKIGGLDRSGGPGHAKRKGLACFFSATMVAQDLMAWIGLEAWIGMVAQVM